MLARAHVFALLGLLAVASSVSAQKDYYPPSRWSVGLNFLVGEPTGEFADFVNDAYGLELTGRMAMEPLGLVNLRGDFGFMIYGHESSRVCFEGVGCRVQARLNTSNNIFYAGIGPELGIPLGWGRPYVHAFMGFGYFNTSSSLEEVWGGEDLFTTEHFGDGTLSWGIGWGMDFDVSRGRTRVAVNLGARYHEHGVMEYLTEGDIIDNPDGSVTLFPNRSEANLITYRIGVSIGFPRGGEDGRDRGSRRRHR